MPATTGAPVTPTKPGWHLVSFQNGDTAVVRWNGHDYVWGSIHAPTSSVTGVTFLGNSITNIQMVNQHVWNSVMASLPGEVDQSLSSALDHGDLQLGRPVLVDNSGKPTGGSNPLANQGEAIPVNAIPSPIDPNAGNSKLNLPSVGSIFGVFASIGFWKGIGLVLAGAAILVFAALEFHKLT